MANLKTLNCFGQNSSVFHRKAFFEAESKLKSGSKFVAVVGSRMVGKTTILLQLRAKYGGEYVSFKNLTVDQADEIFDRINISLRANEHVIMYLDEITYLEDYGRKLAILADTLSEIAAAGDRPNFSVFISGSQEQSITTAIAVAFGGRCVSIRVPFLTFGEYLVYQGKLSWESDFSVETMSKVLQAEDVLDFLENGYKFNALFESPEDYIHGCIDESINSELKESWPSSALVPMEDSDVNDVLAVCYTILIKLHERAKMRVYGNYDELLKKVRTQYNLYHPTEKIKAINFAQAIETTHFAAHTKRNMSKDDFFRILRFLSAMHLIGFIKPNGEQSGLDHFLRGDTREFMTAADFLLKYNPYFTDAQFFIAVLGEIAESIGTTALGLLDNSLLGSMIECMIRGSLARKYRMHTSEYRSSFGAEVDCVVGNLAVEISVRNKDLNETHFEKFIELERYKKVLLTRNVLKEYGDVQCIPFYAFLVNSDLG